MEAGFWVRHWRRFFPKQDAKVVESQALIRFMRALQKKQEKRNDRTAN